MVMSFLELRLSKAGPYVLGSESRTDPFRSTQMDSDEDVQSSQRWRLNDLFECFSSMVF